MGSGARSGADGGIDGFVGAKARFLVCALLALAGCRGAQPPDAAELYLWVWQRGEDLSFIDPAATKIGLWVATITWREQRLDVDARAVPVLYPAGTEILPVIRVEADGGFDTAAAEAVGAEIRNLVAPLHATELQLDFDATVSQRDSYRRLLEHVRVRLPDHRLSITALASWCFGDPWIADLPIDAAVPMYYRMGPDAGQIRHYLSARVQTPATICKDNAGYSLDEPDVPSIAAKRVFVFNPGAWNEQSVEIARGRAAP